MNVELSYPFEPKDNQEMSKDFKPCKTGNSQLFEVKVKSSSYSKFYLFMVVTSFLYSLLVIIYFLFIELDITQPGADRHQMLYYIVDMGMSLFISVFGLISCFMLMSVSSNFSYYANKNSFINSLKGICDVDPSPCKIKNEYNSSNMISSILFQLVHVGVWIFSLYMMWKDQVWKPVATMPFDQDITNTQGYGSGLGGNDYDYTYQT